MSKVSKNFSYSDQIEVIVFRSGKSIFLFVAFWDPKENLFD